MIDFSEERDYREDSQVDKYNLDDEYENHPSIYMYWAEKSVDAKVARIQAERFLRTVEKEVKSDIDEVKAEVNADVRSSPEKYGLTKVINDTVDAAVIRSDKYIEAVADGAERIEKATKEWIKSVENESLLAEVAKSMAMKMSSIEGLERLVLREYYPRSSPSKGVKKAVEKQYNEETKRDLKNAMDGRRLKRKTRKTGGS